jgi:hypothetical protein
MSPLAKLLPLVALGLGLGLGLAWFNRPAAPAGSDISSAHAGHENAALASSANASPAASPIHASDASRSVAVDPMARIDDPASTNAAHADTDSPESTLAPEVRDRLIEEITAAYTTYEPTALPKIAPFLRHSDAEIRSLARDAVVQVGHADGAKLLRDAAKTARDPREAVAFLDAAEYLELPPAPPVSGTFKKNIQSPRKPTASL